MKLRFSIFLIMLFFQLHAQEASERDFPFGIEIIGSQNYGEIDHPDINVQANYSIGVNAIFFNSINSKTTLGFGAGFLNLTYEDIDCARFIGSTDKFTLETNVNYQFATGIIFLKINPFNKNFYIKPQSELWYNVSTFDNSILKERNSILSGNNIDLIKPLNAVHFSLGTSLGFEIPLKSMNLFFEGRGNYFLSKFFKESVETNFNMSSIGASAGVQF